MTAEQLAFDSAAVPTIIGYVGMIRNLIPTGWAKALPIFAVILAMIYAMMLRPGCQPANAECFVAGITLGLSAVGLHGATKNSAEPR